MRVSGPCTTPELKRGWCQIASVQGEGCAARSASSHEDSAKDLLLLEARIQDDDVPPSHVITVVPDGSVTGGDTEVAEVSPGDRVRVGAGQILLVVMVARRRVGALLEPAPRRRIACGVVARPAVGVRVVAEREYGTRNRVDEGSRLPGPGDAALGDVPGADEHLGRARGFHDDGRGVVARVPGGRATGETHCVLPDRGIGVAHGDHPPGAHIAAVYRRITPRQDPARRARLPA